MSLNGTKHTRLKSKVAVVPRCAILGRLELVGHCLSRGDWALSYTGDPYEGTCQTGSSFEDSFLPTIILARIELANAMPVNGRPGRESAQVPGWTASSTHPLAS